MDRELELQALEELRENQQRSKKGARIVFIFVVILASILMVVFPTVLPRPLYMLIMVASMFSILGIVFLGSVGLFLTRRKFGEQRPHKRLAKLSDPDDLNLTVEEALAKCDERQERELAKRRMR